MAILAVIICAKYQIDANVDDSWQILGSNRLEKPSCPAIPQLDLGSSIFLNDIRCVSLDDVV